MDYPENLLDAILRRDFSSFINKAFNFINPSSLYEHNWHIELIAEYLESVRMGQIKRLIINVPPRSLKSICVNVAWPAWILGNEPSKRIMTASYSQTLSIKHSLDCRFIISSDWYKRIFPETILSKKHNQKSKFLTTENGFRFATSVGGSATGEGGDFLIIDDPHNPIHINSQKMRWKVIEWFEQTFLTRLNDKNNGAVILIMQRLHNEDLSGYLLSNNKDWELLKIPIKAICDITFVSGAKKEYLFKEGSALHNKRDKEDYLIKLEREIGCQNFASQYMQEPIEENSSLLKIEEIMFYEQIPQKFDYYIQSIDSAIKISEKADYSVLTSFGILDKTYYLISMIRDKFTYPELKKETEKFAQKYKPKFILIEDKASGQQLLQDLKFDGFTNLIAIKPKLDKITRFVSIVHMFGAGRILIPKKSSFTQVLLKEISNFPNSKNDDIVDSISQFLNYMKEISAKPAFRIRNL